MKLKVNTPQFQRYIILLLVLGSFLIRLYRLDIPHDWSFDEVYHGLSAEAYALNDPRGYEWWNESPKDLAYEWLHPPLGKLFMAASIKLFATPYIPESKAAPLDGKTTFAWRFPGTIFAALTVWLLIKFGKELSGNFWVGALAGFFYAVDGLSFVQSRTGMNDIYVTFFVLLTFYRIYRFLGEYPKRIIPNLAWLGLATGLAATSKWTGFYAVAIAFVIGVGMVLKKRNWKLVPMSIFYLAVIPVLVYVLSYGQWWLQGHSWDQFVELHKQIWWYQTNLDATHDYQSAAYTWPFLVRPVWFYVKYEDKIINGQTESYIGNIYTMGHPLIWWMGLIAIVYVVWLLVKRYAVVGILSISGASREASIRKYIQGLFSTSSNNTLNLGLVVLLMGYFGMFLPWVASPRIMFLYHYLPSIPFLCLILAYVLVQWYQKGGKNITAVWLYVLLVGLLFFYFYPHWSGLALPQKFVATYYWFPTWK